MEQKHLDYLESLGPIMPANVKPAYRGWYARGYPGLGGRTYWLAARDYFDGARWFIGYENGVIDRFADPVPMRWRGLARPSNESSEAKRGSHESI